MFARIAKFRPFEPRHVTHAVQPATYSNDNLPGFRRPEGRCLRPKQAPTCHWYLIDGRLECRWDFDDGGDPTTADLNHQFIADGYSMRRAALTARAGG